MKQFPLWIIVAIWLIDKTLGWLPAIKAQVEIANASFELIHDMDAIERLEQHGYLNENVMRECLTRVDLRYKTLKYKRDQMAPK